MSRDPGMTRNTLLQVVRRSLKGRAAQVVGHMSDYVPVETILQKLDKMFGDVLPVETLLQQFYTARQDVNEDAGM